MGSPARIVTDRASIADAAQARVADLEQRWSRFLPTSEVSGANRNAGYPTVVSADTLELFERARYAHERTKGLFNPLLLHQIEALGYDRPFSAVGPAVGGPIPPVATATVFVSVATQSVVVPSNTGFDPGGIGKGLAGDIVTREAVADGATTFLVELGGDVRVAGAPWHGDDEWTVAIGHVDGSVGTVRLRDGGIATSSTQRIRWQRNAETVHHILDGRTGQPVTGETHTATIVASELWWAEVGATCAFGVPASEWPALFDELDLRGCASHASASPAALEVHV